MTVKETVQLITGQLSNYYPAEELDSFTYLIFSHLMGFKRFESHTKSEVEIPSHLAPQIYDIIEQLKQHKPIQYILGTTDFYGLPFYVNESVLIPRPETEELVHWIVQDFTKQKSRIIDLGTGSGCIPVALAKNLPDAEVYAADISEEALEVAGKNAKQNEVNIHLLKLDLLSEDWPDTGLFDVIVSNPPYVTIDQKDRMDVNVLDFEPYLALFVPENDPLVFYKAISRFAVKHLKTRGSLYFEINEALYSETEKAVSNLGFSTELKKDINGKYRMLKAKLL